MLDTIKKHPFPAVVAACVAFGVLGFLFHGWLSGRGTRLLPDEYVYLDSARVNAYLGQLENGLSSSERRSLSTTSSTSAGLNAGGYLSLTGSATSTQSVEGTVAPDEGDRFYQLFNAIRQTSQWRYIDLTHTAHPSPNFASIPVGHFVQIYGARLAVPRFALPVPALSQCAQEPFGSSTAIAPSRIASLVANYPRAVGQYLRSFGRDPSIPLSVEIVKYKHGTERVVPAEKGVDVVRVPVLLDSLLNSPSLMSGSVTIFGKVIRQVQPRTSSGPFAITDRSYYDTFAAVAAERALTTIPSAVEKVLGLPRGHEAILHLVTQAEEAKAPSTVILPIAIFT